VVLKEPVGKSGDHVCLLLPGIQGGKIYGAAKIIRTWKNGEGYGMAVRFQNLTSQDEKQLQQVLHLLAQPRDKEGQRTKPKLAQSIELQYGNHQELRTTLEEISQGALRIMVPDPLTLNQSFQVSISMTDGHCGLTLRARVMQQRLINVGSLYVYHIDLEFEHSPEELEEMVGKVLHELAHYRPPR
jgi:hypothetical protein